MKCLLSREWFSGYFLPSTRITLRLKLHTQLYFSKKSRPSITSVAWYDTSAATSTVHQLSWNWIIVSPSMSTGVWFIAVNYISVSRIIRSSTSAAGIRLTSYPLSTMTFYLFAVQLDFKVLFLKFCRSSIRSCEYTALALCDKGTKKIDQCVDIS